MSSLSSHTRSVYILCPFVQHTHQRDMRDCAHLEIAILAPCRNYLSLGNTRYISVCNDNNNIVGSMYFYVAYIPIRHILYMAGGTQALAVLLPVRIIYKKRTTCVDGLMRRGCHHHTADELREGSRYCRYMRVSCVFVWCLEEVQIWVVPNERLTIRRHRS